MQTEMPVGSEQLRDYALSRAAAALVPPSALNSVLELLQLLVWTADARGAIVRTRVAGGLRTVSVAGQFAAAYPLGEVVPLGANPYCRAVHARGAPVYLRGTRTTRAWRDGLDYRRGVLAYAGHPITNDAGEIVGTVALLFDHPINRANYHQQLLRRFTTQLAQILVANVAQPSNAPLHFAPRVDASRPNESRLKKTFDVRSAEREYARLATVVEQSTDAIALVSPAGRIEYVNPAFTRLTGVERGRSVGRVLAELETAQDDPAQLENMLDTVRTGGIWKGQLSARSRIGKRICTDVHVSAVQDQQRDVVGYVAIVRDITQELELERRLRQAEKMEAVGQLAGGISHDFNNVLTAIFGSIGLLRGHLRTGKLDEAVVQRGLEQIQGAARHAATLTRQLLAFAREQVLRLEPLDANRVIRDAERLVRRLLTENIALELDLTPNAYIVQADVGQLEQLIINLCVNARDAMQAGGRVTIATRNVELDDDYARTHHDAGTGPHLCLHVSDDGAGIDKDNIDHIFEPFFTTKPVGKGTGLGLSTVYAIVRRLGGHITVESEPGFGTEFAIYLPRVSEPAAAGNAVDSVEYFPRGRESILICEDDDAIREIEQELLERCGHRVVATATAEEVLALPEHELDEIDVFITDVVLPGISGGELARRLRERSPDAQVLFISGHTHETLRSQSPEVLKDPVLYKPFTSREFLQHVRATLDGNSADA